MGLFSGFGDDKILGGNGVDELYGELGNDELLGGAGDDILDGGDGADIIDGGAGADTLIDSAGDDLYFVGAGDLLRVGSGQNEVRASSGVTDLSTTTIDFSSYGSTNSSNTLTDAGIFRDFSGNNVADYKISYGGGSIVLDQYTSLSVAPDIILANGVSLQLSNYNIEGFGSEGNDLYSELSFISQNDFVYAGGGDDAFTFLDGDDTIYGGEGNDTLGKQILSGNTPQGTGKLVAYGEGGDDSLTGGLGDDILDGGVGNDFITDIVGGNNQMFGVVKTQIRTP